MTILRQRLFATACAMILAGPALAQQLFWSTQAAPIEETQAMRERVLTGFPDGAVDYQASEAGPWITRLQAETQAGSGTISVLGGLHGDFAGVLASLSDLADADIDASAIQPGLMDLGKLGGEEQKYIPWMQATFIMAANKKALSICPRART